VVMFVQNGHRWLDANMAAAVTGLAGADMSPLDGLSGQEMAQRNPLERLVRVIVQLFDMLTNTESALDTLEAKNAILNTQLNELEGKTVEPDVLTPNPPVEESEPTRQDDDVPVDVSEPDPVVVPPAAPESASTTPTVGESVATTSESAAEDVIEEIVEETVEPIGEAGDDAVELVVPNLPDVEVSDTQEIAETPIEVAE